MGEEVKVLLADESRILEKEEYIKDREQFVHNLGVLLSQTREGVESCTLDSQEQVHVKFRRSDYEVIVNVRHDSYLALARDVIKSL